MTPEQRLYRAERILLGLIKAGRRARTQFRAEHREINEKINILIDTQIDTSEQLKKTGEQIESLTASQAKTDESLRRLINSLRKRPNGNSSN
jgi:hypothetical protein